MSRSIRNSLATLAVVLATASQARAADPAEGKPIDLVLCLDVSGSMNGLIDSAKVKLWDVVNELARLKPTPNLRVGLYSYGHDTYPAANGWVRKEIDLTSDLDDVYKALNGLTINGGTELVARVSNAALTEQKWSTDPGALKLLFVCGNEAANQDKVIALDTVSDLAKKNGVVINTIFCGTANHPQAVGWNAFAQQCGGRGVSIDQNKSAQAVVVKTEFDERILKLNEKLNSTYVCYGKKGAEAASNQATQDRNALAAPTAPGSAPAPALARAQSKAGALYNCATWDLVDKMKEKDFDLAKIAEADLPEELKKLKPAERLEFIKQKSAERDAIQKEILDLSAKRQKKIDEEVAKLPKTDKDKALDEAVKGLVRDQAKERGFEVPGDK